MQPSANLMLSESAGSALADVLRGYAAYREDIAADLLTPDVGGDIDDRQFEFERARAEKSVAGRLYTADLFGDLADRVEHGGAVKLTADQCSLIEDAIDNRFADRAPTKMIAIVQSIRDAIRPTAIEHEHDQHAAQEIALGGRKAQPLNHERPAQESMPDGRSSRSDDLGSVATSGSSSNRRGHDRMTGPVRPVWRIDDVLARTDLANLLDQLAEPATHTTRGRRWHCPIADHDDRHASVTVHTDHRGHERWRCWSGDDTHRGDAIDLVTATQRMSRTDAIDWLANRAGMIPDQPLPAPLRKPTSQPAIVPLDPAVVRYVDACQRILWTTHAGRPVYDWLHQRGFDDDVLRANHVGADPGRQLMHRRRGLPHGTSVAATFPALDPTGDIAYVQARYLEPRDGPKYDNPAGHLGTNPRLAWTQTPHAQHQDLLIVCEGIPDALAAAQTGYRSVGILGAQAPDLNVATRLVTASHQCDIVAVIDADDAGRAWGDRLVELCETAGTTIQIVEPPDSLDLNTWTQLDPAWTEAMPSPRANADIEPLGADPAPTQLTY